jgi:S-(hydroxymethyl)glutathione dehydrogenase/alcohol dehydrogenase
MKAIVYHSPYELAVEDVPDPQIKDPREIIIRVTSTAICGTDLHLYHGLMARLNNGVILGHEFMGIVEEIGRDVTKWKKGDRVLVPSIIACGQCEMCRAGLKPHCVKSNKNGETGHFLDMEMHLVASKAVKRSMFAYPTLISTRLLYRNIYRMIKFFS